MKDAIRVAKPYFFLNVVQPRLDTEARKVFDAFKAEATGNAVLHYYFMHRDYPDLMVKDASKNPLWLMSRFSEQREKAKFFESIFPQAGGKYALKYIMSMMG